MPKINDDFCAVNDKPSVAESCRGVPFMGLSGARSRDRRKFIALCSQLSARRDHSFNGRSKFREKMTFSSRYIEEYEGVRLKISTLKKVES